VREVIPQLRKSCFSGKDALFKSSWLGAAIWIGLSTIDIDEKYCRPLPARRYRSPICPQRIRSVG
jgi:hypothetical protein